MQGGRLLWLSIAGGYCARGCFNIGSDQRATLLCSIQPTPFDIISQPITQAAGITPDLFAQGSSRNCKLTLFQARDDEIDIQLSGSVAAFIIWLTMLRETDWKPHQAEVFTAGVKSLTTQTCSCGPTAVARSQQRNERQQVEAIASIAAQFEQLPRTE